MEPLVFFYPVGHEAHFDAGHPERPERIEAICQSLQEAGWWERYPHLQPISPVADILREVHTERYLEWLQQTCRRGAYLDGDTYTTPASWELALRAAGGCMAVAEAVWCGEARRGYALPRPPGHHATPAYGMGFCLLNNIALAAVLLIHRGAKRLAIVDLDLHHGNGTQEIFWERNDVFFISTHQSPLYPGSGQIDEIGGGKGLGFTANIPMPPATGDGGYNAAMREVILPLLEKHQPEMILVSLGFDAHWKDPLGHLRLSARGIADLIQSLVVFADGVCDGRIVLVQEGGYDLEVLRACAQAATAALLQLPVQDPLGPSPRGEGQSWQTVLTEIKKIWQL